MKILKNIILGLVLLVFEYSMFQISLELGLASLVLSCAVLCIWIVLKRITTIVVHPKLALSSAPFRDSANSANNDILTANQRSSAADNLIPGVNANIFEQFREKLNLDKNPDSPPSRDSLPVENSSSAPQNNGTPDLLTDAYQKAGTFNGPENFSEELDEVEQVKVTLSENAKILQEKDEDEDELEEKQEHELEDNHEDELEEKHELAEEVEPRETKKQANINSANVETEKKLGAGEAALELLSAKHQALKEQTASLAVEPLVDFDEDLFADELIPIPGGETYVETDSEIFRDEEPYPPLTDAYRLEDEEHFDSSLQSTTPLEEKYAEAEALLKLATTACESGRMNEAKAGLDSYLNILKELGQAPSSDVLQLAEKLELPLDSSSKKADFSIKELPKTAVVKKQESPLKDLPEQTNYANVMDGIVKSLEEKNAYEEALPLLKDLLNYNRQRVNISAMDPLYDRIEQAHSSMQNDEELVAAYKEHLAIKQQLGDLEGELHLLDLISYYYANTSDQKASERYQAESKRIKASLDNKMKLEQ